MTYPRIEVDLSKIHQNTQTVVRRLKARGIGVTGVTKAVCGHPAIAKAMLEGGAAGIADSRLSNVQKLREAGMTCPITLIRTPMLSQVDQVVHFCEVSYNTEVDVIMALAAAATRKGMVHGVILMVEMGDQREGILPEDLAAVAQQVMKTPGVVLKGVGANFACLSSIAPDAAKMAALSALANKVEGLCGPVIQTVSGGNSSNLIWAQSKRSTGRINDLRLGEAILQGVDPVCGEQIGGMYTDAFALVAEVIETQTIPTPVSTWFANPTLAQPRLVSNMDGTQRLILAIGQQDTDISGLSLSEGSAVIGATSDHLVVSTNQSELSVGSKVRFRMNYKSLMHAMAAPDIETKLLNGRSTKRLRHTQDKAEFLTLI